MSRDRFPPDDPREWMNRARSNLLRARMPFEGVYLDDLCFDAQQAAEKAVKAVLISRSVPFPYVHDLAELLAIVEETGILVPEAVQGSARLTRFAVTTRYPGLTEPVTPEEYASAVAIADVVVQWADEVIVNEIRDTANDGVADGR